MACLASMLFCPMKRLDNGISHAASASSCPAGEVYRSIGEQANAEPAETTQHACPSTGHEQQETACEGEWNRESGLPPQRGGRMSFPVRSMEASQGPRR